MELETAEALPAKKPRKVAIVGTAPSSRTLAPFDDPTWEIWVIKLYNAVPRWDRWYEIHDLESGKARWPKDYTAFLQTDHGKPVYMQETSPEIPNSVRFPREEIIKVFGRYFTNSIAWMIAHAMVEGVDEIGLFGVDMAQDTEYRYQRPCCEYYIGLAVGRGITVHIPPQSDLLKSQKLYAMDGDHSLLTKVAAWDKELAGQQDQAAMNEQAAHDKNVFLAGARDAIKRFKQWS